MAKVFFSLGSSLGDRRKTLIGAINSIENHIGSVLKTSNVFETEPWGFQDKNMFLNMAVLVQTKLSPEQILQKSQQIEKLYNRKKTGNNYEARTLDIDIVFYDNLVFDNSFLQIPHKFAHKRIFVLLPIAEIAPDFVHPILKQTISRLLKNCDDKTSIKIFN